MACAVSPTQGSRAFLAEPSVAGGALERSRRRLRGLERHLADIGYRGEAYAAANIAAEIELAIQQLAGTRVQTAA